MFHKNNTKKQNEKQHKREIKSDVHKAQVHYFMWELDHKMQN